MKKIILKGIDFVKENPGIIYSLVLVVLIPAAFFANTYLTNSSYEKNIDKITQRKAILTERIINIAVEENLQEKEALQEKIKKITQENPGIILVNISKKRESGDEFEIFASSNENLIGQEITGNLQKTQNVIAWTQPEGVAVLDEKDGKRFWNVTKSFLDENGEKVGLISIAFSLEDSDALIKKTIYNSYWILIITVLVVILFVSNQARLFGYALTLSKLKEVDKMKDMFISMASHELRSPLTAIKGYLEFLKEKKEVTADQEAAHYVENISLSVERLQELVNDILEVSRAEGNRLPIEMIAFDPRKTIVSSVEELRSQAIQKGLKLNLKIPEEEVLIEADESRLKQILVNLIGNSIKYTPKGSVDVSAEARDKEFLITVADTGIGISSEDQKNLFQKFYRVKNEKTKDIIGTGLGLWITSEIAKRMNGRITLESIEGVGSHFTLFLPITSKK